MTAAEPASIRPIDLEDSGSMLELLALQMAAYVKEAEMIGLSDIPPLFESPEAIRGTGELFFGCYAGGVSGEAELAGAVSVLDENVTYGRTIIRRLMVRPDRFRRGTSAALLHFVLECAGNRRVTVRTLTANTAAMALYARFGFRPVGETVLENGWTLAELER